MKKMGVCWIRLDRSLMIGWRKNSWNPLRVSSVFTFVCLRVCKQAKGHILGPRNLFLVILVAWEKGAFFRNFNFYIFIVIFRFFHYTSLVNFGFQATGHSFSPRNMIFGGREPCTIKNWKLWNVFRKFHFSIFKGLFLPIFLQFFNITLMVLEMSMHATYHFRLLFFSKYDGNK